MSWYYLIAFLPILIILFTNTETIKQLRAKQLAKKRGYQKNMDTMLVPFIGKDCIIRTLTDTVEGKLSEISSNGVVLATKNSTIVLNIDYIVSVKEHPLNKNGKKKALIFSL